MEDIEKFSNILKDFEYFRDFQSFLSPKNNARKITQIKKTHPRFNPLTDLNEHKFRLKYRYTKENLRRIIEIVRDDLEIEYFEPLKREQVPIDLQILSAIRLWGGTEVNISVCLNCEFVCTSKPRKHTIFKICTIN